MNSNIVFDYVDFSMVRKEGQENGLGIWEVSGYESLWSKFRSNTQDFFDEQEFINEDKVSIQDAKVVGSYGNGDGVQGKSDLDVIISVRYIGDVTSNDYSKFLRHLAGHLKKNETQILSNVGEVSELDLLVYPEMEVRQQIMEMAVHEPVETFYSLKSDEKRDI